MVWSWFSSENKGGEGVAAAVGFVRRVVVATMGCFFGCFGVNKDSHSQFVAPTGPVVSRNKNALSSLFISDDNSLLKDEESMKSQPDELDVRELKDQAKFLKACGTLPETPLEIRKASERWEDIPSKYGEQKVSNFNSFLFPIASIEKLELDKQPVESPSHVKVYEELVTGTGSNGDSPTSCMTDGDINGRHSSSSMHCGNLQSVTTPKDAHRNTSNCSETSSVSPGVLAPSVQCKNKSVRFDCGSDRASSDSLKGSSSETASQQSKRTGSAVPFSVSKPSPYPTPLKLTDDMQTPGTVFPAYLDNVAHGKTARVRSQYVCRVLDSVEGLHQCNELKNEHLDSNQLSESDTLNDEAALMSTSTIDMEMKDPSVEKEIKDEGGLASWFKPQTSKDDDKKKHFGSIAGENVHFRKSPGDRPIIGMVAAHWNDDETSRISPKWWDGNGIPNSTNKYREDQKVSWHATPFEERLEKALSEETFISKRKPISGTPPVDFAEAEESDTALSHLQSSTHFNSVVSF